MRAAGRALTPAMRTRCLVGKKSKQELTRERQPRPASIQGELGRSRCMLLGNSVHDSRAM